MYTVLFMPTYAAQQLGLPATGGFLAGLVTGAVQVLLIPIVGAFTDRHGRIPIAVASTLMLLLTIYPMFVWLAAVPTLRTLLIVQAILGVLLSGYMGGLPALMSELFPVATRTTGLSISYALSAAIFGGFAPLLDAWLIDVTGSKLAPSFYLMVAALISLTALLAARRASAR
jgi:MHS family proline/betaine transporter-like MFS transporter